MKRKLAGGFVTLLSGLAVYIGLSTGLLDYRVSGWPTTEGTVLTKEVVRSEHATGSGPAARFEARVEYRYEVDGETYTSDRTHTVVRVLMKEDAEAALAEIGETVTVHYDPEDPSQAYLFPGSLTLPIILVVAGLIGVLIGIGLLVSKVVDGDSHGVVDT